MTKKIRELYAYICMLDGKEGIAGAVVGDQLITLVTGEKKMAETFQQHAQRCANEHQITIQAVKFTTREVIGIIEPETLIGDRVVKS